MSKILSFSNAILFQFQKIEVLEWIDILCVSRCPDDAFNLKNTAETVKHGVGGKSWHGYVFAASISNTSHKGG